MDLGLARLPFPEGTDDEVELLLRWLGFLRGAVLRKAGGITDEQSRWRPDGKLIPLIGIVNHLTGVETRWVDGEMLGAETGKPADEYDPPQLTIADAVAAYEARAAATDAAVRRIGDLTTASRYGHDTDLRFVLLHLINETARHAGHADAVRELLDGAVGE
ncbi:DUF664 domain-containing protein [Actinoplanes sp. NBRC 103695]|uniref:mycothiol transferase n=1 Tax=Actinoplanes sp. NBRC 103695 TaxID=3032202 RepID=UPI0024A5EF9B|nr:DUF664 domain-containing protein [Actinoplanes sp. NBRC 103695]GLY96115.1 hypothetical protein Acsp02_33700 [Actinoplanes sp. NBRC 103695]